MSRGWLLGLILLHACRGGDQRETPAEQSGGADTLAILARAPADKLGYRLTRSGHWYHFSTETGSGAAGVSLDVAFGREAGFGFGITRRREGRERSPMASLPGALPLASAPLEALARGPSRGNLLTSTLWTHRDVLVCWEASALPFAAERRWVEASIAGSWQRHSAIRFEYWGPCDSVNSAAHIHIGVWNERPRTRGLGTSLGGLGGGVMLNFMNPWPYCRVEERRGCIENIAIHEFGHALGFAHQQNRADTPNAYCAAEDDLPQGPDGDLYGGPWDEDSVMNYCGGGNHLSSGDIAAVQQAYGAPPPSNAIVIYRRDIDYIAGLFGASREMTVGEAPCRNGFRRAACDARPQPDGKGWCGQTRWLSDDPNDCRCELHVGVGALQRAHCIAEVLAEPPSAAAAPVACGDGACDPSESCVSCGGDCGPCAPELPGDPIVHAAEENFIAGVVGSSGEASFGGACPPGLRRKQCVARRQADSAGWCGGERWLSDDETDCRCEYQRGVGPLQRLHCTVQVTAVGPSPSPALPLP